MFEVGKDFVGNKWNIFEELFMKGKNTSILLFDLLGLGSFGLNQILLIPSLIENQPTI